MKYENLIWLVLIGGSIILGIFRYIYSSRKRKKRAVRLKEVGPQLPLHSFPNEDLISRFKEPTGVMRFGKEATGVARCLFYSKRKTGNLMEGNIGPIDFITFEYKYKDRWGRGGTILPGIAIRQGTAILLQSDQLALPSFKLDRETKRSLEEFHPLTPLKAKEKAGSKQCPTCGNWDVRGGAIVEHGGIGEYCDHCKKSLWKMNEEKARKLYSTLSSDLHGWLVLASNTQLLLYREQKPIAAEKYQEFMEEALKIFQLFESSSQILKEDF